QPGDLRPPRPALLVRESHARRLVRSDARAEGDPRLARIARNAAGGESNRVIVPVGVDADWDRRRGRPGRAPDATEGPWTVANPEKRHLNHDNPSMQPPGEETLVERARRGDPVAFEELVLAYQSLAFRTAFVITGDAADAEEAAQDAFVKAHKALGRFRTG